jgi:hypothetical protein
MDQLPREIPQPKGTVQVNLVSVFKTIKKLINEKFNPSFLFRKRSNPSDVVDDAIRKSRTGGGS